MAQELHFDRRGRVTIPARFRERLGDRVVAILMPQGVVLRPVSEGVEIPDDAPDVSGDEEARADVDRQYPDH